MSYYTKGEWTSGVTPCKDNGEALAICKENIDAHKSESSGHFIEVYLSDGRRVALVGHGPDGIANGYLISAAPDLLEALMEVVKISDRKHDAWDKAKDAISKALGHNTN